MLYSKYSSNRILFLNEYWIFIPSALLANYVIIRKIRLHREKMKQIKKLIKRLEHERKIRQIRLLSLALNGSVYLLICGGATDFMSMVDTTHIKCYFEQGVNYSDDVRLRNIVNDLYRYKRKGKLIYITATAVCHLADMYGQVFLALPFAVSDFVLTNIYQTVRKAVVTSLLAGVVPLMNGPVPSFVALLLAIGGLRLASRNLDFIATSPVDFTEK